MQQIEVDKENGHAYVFILAQRTQQSYNI